MNHGADLYCKLFVSGAADDEALSAAVNAALREDAGRAAAGADAVPMLDIARHLSVASRMMRPFTCQQAPCRLTTPPPPPASQAPRTWHATLIEATRSGVRPEQGVFTQAMPPLAASARALGILRRAKAFLLAHPVRL